jgi:hypothetical protein
LSIVCRYVTDVCALTLYPATLLNSWAQTAFLAQSLGFFIFEIVICKGYFASSFQIWMPLISFSYNTVKYGFYYVEEVLSLLNVLLWRCVKFCHAFFKSSYNVIIMGFFNFVLCVCILCWFIFTCWAILAFWK